MPAPVWPWRFYDDAAVIIPFLGAPRPDEISDALPNGCARIVEQVFQQSCCVWVALKGLPEVSAQGARLEHGLERLAHQLGTVFRHRRGTGRQKNVYQPAEECR